MWFPNCERFFSMGTGPLYALDNGSLGCVQQMVPCSAGQCCKPSTTPFNIALERLLPCVCSVMNR